MRRSQAGSTNLPSAKQSMRVSGAEGTGSRAVYGSHFTCPSASLTCTIFEPATDLSPSSRMPAHVGSRLRRTNVFGAMIKPPLQALATVSSG